MSVSTTVKNDPEQFEALLALPVTYSDDEQPHEFVESVVKRLSVLLSATVNLHWTVHGAPPEPGAEVMRMRVTQGRQPYAVIDALPSAPLSPSASLLLSNLGRHLSLTVDALTDAHLNRFAEALRTNFAIRRPVQTAAAQAVGLIRDYMRAAGGALLLRKADDLSLLASVGECGNAQLADLAIREVATVGLRSLGATEHQNGFVSVPLASAAPARCLVVLHFPDDTPVHRAASVMLEKYAALASPYVDAIWRDKLLNDLLELNRTTEETDSGTLYGLVLQKAINLVPGADSGTLLTRTNPSEPFNYQAAVGFDLEALRSRQVSERAARKWYGDESGWLEGRPRILDQDGIKRRVAAGGLMGPDPQAAVYEEIRSTICLPVLRDGMVMAVLNLDGMHDAHGLAEDSKVLVTLFSGPLASLLHRQRSREALWHAARTDDLTGLANRRAFDEALELELMAAQQADGELSVLVMDLRDFKNVNDHFGHAAGDAVLIEVSEALTASLRDVDLAARRGGDEFTALLPGVSSSAATTVAERVKLAVAGVDGGLGALKMNVGCATYPADGEDPATLLRVADRRMYQDKLAEDN